MSETTFNLIIVVLGALVAGLAYLNQKQAIHLKDMVPPEVASILVNLLQDLASRTPNTDDDDIVKQLKDLLEAQKAQAVQKFDGRP